MASLALKCRSLEKDVAPAADLTVACASCDPDNPRAVPRSSCKECRGTGLARVLLASVMGEIHSSRLELLKGGKGGREKQPFDFDD